MPGHYSYQQTVHEISAEQKHTATPYIATLENLTPRNLFAEVYLKKMEKKVKLMQTISKLHCNST